MEKHRIRYTKEFRRSAVLSVMQGKKSLEVLLSCGFDLSEVLKNDKKYASKLIHKWKKEFFKNQKSLCSLNIQDKDSIQNEISNLADNNEEDTISDYIKTQILNGVNNYKRLSSKLGKYVKN